MIFSVTLQLSQSLTCERERGAMTAGVGASKHRSKPRDPEISVPGLYGAQSKWAHQYSLTAPAPVPGDQQNKVAEVTDFTSRGERPGDRGRERMMLGTIREEVSGKMRAKKRIHQKGRASVAAGGLWSSSCLQSAQHYTHKRNIRGKLKTCTPRENKQHLRLVNVNDMTGWLLWQTHPAFTTAPWSLGNNYHIQNSDKEYRLERITREEDEEDKRGTKNPDKSERRRWSRLGGKNKLVA